MDLKLDLWSVWQDCHENADQKKRLASGKKADCTPAQLNTANGSGEFSGKHGTYQTTLAGCSCVDFARRKLPCKHMYRLAIELGVIQEEVMSDTSEIVKPLTNGLQLRDLVAAIENIPEQSQMYLKKTLLNMIFRGKDPIKLDQTKELDDVLELGILVPDKSGLFTIADNAKSKIRKLYTYLIRKFDTESVFDANSGKMVEIPKGARPYMSFHLSDGTSTSGIEFPDDEVTVMLDLFGTNRCKDWPIKQ